MALVLKVLDQPLYPVRVRDVFARRLEEEVCDLKEVLRQVLKALVVALLGVERARELVNGEPGGQLDRAALPLLQRQREPERRPRRDERAERAKVALRGGTRKRGACMPGA